MPSEIPLISDLSVRHLLGPDSQTMDEMSDDQNGSGCTSSHVVVEDHGFCAICLERIPLQETALVKATWFVPLILKVEEEAAYQEEEVTYFCEEDEDDLEDETYFDSSSSVRIGNRRWGDNGYIQAGRKEARPVYQDRFQDASAGSSRGPRNKEASKDVMGRRAKRAMKREAADKAAAAKHQMHLQRLGRK
ncbi:hypothetical protein ACLOJK_000513 [Asimina triloba]